MSLFKLKGELSSRQELMLTIFGFGLLLLLWILFSFGENPIIPKSILPKPSKVLLAYGELYRDNQLMMNITRSVSLNIAGYVEAILLAVPFGFIVGLFPFFRGAFQRQVDALRFVPLTAVSGIFIASFGIGTDMRVHFLAFGIFIYLLPVVVQRIDEISDVYRKTVYTLGANTWQTIRSVYIPAVFSKISDDIRVLTAISWTYIIIAEGYGSKSGIGLLIWRVGERSSRPDKVFALLIIIILIGFLQDKLFIYLDRKFFPHKYVQDAHNKSQKKKSSIDLVLNYFWNTLSWTALVGYLVLMLNEVAGFFNDKVLSEAFGETTWVMNALVLLVLAYKIKSIVMKPKRVLTTQKA